MDVPARSEGSPSQGAILCLQTLLLCRGIRGARRRPNRTRCTIARLGHCDYQGKPRAPRRGACHTTVGVYLQNPERPEVLRAQISFAWCLLAEPPATTSFAGANKPCLETRISSTQLQKSARANQHCLEIQISNKKHIKTKRLSGAHNHCLETKIPRK